MKQEVVRRAYKMHGAGNDFVVLIGSGENDADGMASAALQLCDRHRSIGADGLVWVDVAALPRLAQVRVWNPDGSVVGMCLNAARCVVVLLSRLFDIAEIQLCFGHISIEAWVVPGGARLQFSLQSPEGSDVAATEIGPNAWFVNLADPHVVIEWRGASAVREAPLANIAATHAAGGGFSDRSSNCHIVARDDSSGHHRIRSFERRVEAETLACGSGCVASYLALSLEGEQVFLTTSGDRIQLSRALSCWSLEGPALMVFHTDVRTPA